MDGNEPTGKVWVRRLIAAWFICMTSWVTYQVFLEPEKISMEVNLAFGTVITALTGITAYWMKKGNGL